MKGEEIPFDEIKKDIEARDKQDMTRKFAPLVIPEKAVVIDTSDMTIEQVVDLICQYVCR